MKNMRKNHRIFARLLAAMLCVCLLGGCMTALADEDKGDLGAMVTIDPRESTDIRQLVKNAQSYAALPEGDAVGAPQLRLGDSGTEEGYCEKIPVYEDLLDSKEKLWNKVVNPTVVGDEYVISTDGKTVTAADPAGNILATGEDLGPVVNKAIEAMDEQGGILLIQDGEYLLVSPIELKSNVHIYGIDRPVINCGGEKYAIYATQGVEHAAVCNLILKGFGEGSGIYFENFTRYNYLADLYMPGFNYAPIFFTGLSSMYNVITRCKLVDVKNQSGITFFDGAGWALVQDNYVLRTREHGIIFSTGGTGSKILDNVVVDAGAYLSGDSFAHGIALDGSGKIHGLDNLVQGNMIKNAGMAGIEIADFQDYCTVVCNVVDGTGVYKNQDCYGIYFGGGLSESSECTIAFNTVRNTAGPGIRTTSPAKKPFTKFVNILNNDIAASGEDGILIQKADEVYVENNRITGSGVLSENGCAIAIRATEEGAHVIVIKNNICADSKEYGVLMQNSVHVDLEDNQFTNNAAGDYKKENSKYITFIQ